jgi:glycosyltransferase involved in cell wall biosynthesis
VKLLYTITSYPPAVGGAQIHTHLLAQQIQKTHEVAVSCHWSQNRTDWLLGTTLKQPTAHHQYVFEGISITQLGFSLRQKLSLLPYIACYYPLMSFSLPPIARTISKTLQPVASRTDLIHNVRMGREGLSYASLQLARQKNIPFVFTPLHHPRWTGWRYRQYIELYRQADAIIALTMAEKQTLVELDVSPEKIHITGIGPVLSTHASPSNFQAKYGITEPFVLFLGQHYRYKGYQQLLKATRTVWLQHPDTHFVFAGPSVKNSEKVFAEFADSRIHRLGTVSLQDKTDALAACTLLCVPSTQESFGGVYTEAWHFRKPVVGGNIPAIADVIQDGVDGYLVEQKPEMIAERIVNLLDYPDQAEKMGRVGYQKVCTRYAWTQLAAATEKIYEAIA